MKRTTRCANKEQIQESGTSADDRKCVCQTNLLFGESDHSSNQYVKQEVELKDREQYQNRLSYEADRVCPKIP